MFPATSNRSYLEPLRDFTCQTNSTKKAQRSIHVGQIWPGALYLVIGQVPYAQIGLAAHDSVLHAVVKSLRFSHEHSAFAISPESRQVSIAEARSVRRITKLSPRSYRSSAAIVQIERYL